MVCVAKGVGIKLSNHELKDFSMQCSKPSRRETTEIEGKICESDKLLISLQKIIEITISNYLNDKQLDV